MKKLRVGIVGFGYMGEIREWTVRDHPNYELVGVVDPGYEDRIRKAGYRAFEDYQSLCAEGLDGLFVCTPNNVTPEAVVYGLDQGLHVFCEKPPGRNLGDIQRIREAEARNPQCKLIFGFNHRHHPGIADVRALIASGSLGRLLTVRGVYGKSGGYGYEKSWRNDPAVGGGGILLDQGIHMLDLFRYFCGDFDQVVGLRASSFWDIPVEDNAMLLLRSEKGHLAQLHSTATSWNHTFRLELGLEGGYLNARGLLSKSGSYGRETLVIGRRPPNRDQAVSVGNPREETTYYDDDPSWELELAHWTSCILEDRPVEQGSSLDALRVMEIIDQVYQTPIDTLIREGA